MYKALVKLLLLIFFIGVCTPTSFVAANSIKIIVDGKEIVADQPPVLQNGRTLVPLRSIFEALKAKVDYNEQTKTITATRGTNKIILTIGSKNAWIDNKLVELEVPAQTLNGRTLVPVRFVSEAFGDDIYYNNQTKQVTIKTKSLSVSNIGVSDVNNFGDGRDLEINFEKVADQTIIDHYRVLVVKSSKAKSFTLSEATKVASNRYAIVPKAGNNHVKMTLANLADTDGAPIETDISYTVFVLAMSNNVNKMGHSLSAPSEPITLTFQHRADSVTNVRINDVSDFGDGRDLEVSFTKVADESRVREYRVFVVKSNDINNFNLSTAKETQAGNYTVVHKTNANIKTILARTARDYKGNTIIAGTAYRVFVLSVGEHTRGYGSALSAASNELTLSGNPGEIQATNITVRDVADYNDGRDLQVSFNIPAGETRLSEYRIMVVPNNEVSNFTLTKANNISSSNYTVVRKTGSNQTVTLSSNARDVNGNLIQNDRSYRVFILSVGGEANSNKNSLSSYSSAITLTSNFKTTAVSNVRANDISDFGDGRDIQVTFNKVSDETNIGEYRIMIIKSSQADGFTLSTANSVSSSNYTSVSKTGSNISRTLSSSTRDVYGEIIREDVSYRVFVLSVSRGGNNSNNALSAASSAFQLTKNAATLPAVTGVTARDAGNAGDGSDLEVKFNKLNNETLATEYRILVVKADEAASFNVTSANAITANNYTRVSKTGSNITQRLSSSARDVSGAQIKPDIDYRVFVLAVSSVGSLEYNSLSQPSAIIKLSNPKVSDVGTVTVRDVANNGNGQDLEVSFVKPASESNIAYYAVMVVPETDAGHFTLATANGVANGNFTKINKTGSNISQTLSASAKDTRGRSIENGTSYRVFVMAVADGVNASINTLSAPSNSIILSNKSLSFSGSFQESMENDGSISSAVTATLIGDTFAQELVQGVHYTATNIPSGLTLQASRSSNQVVFTINGSASSHGASNSVYNVTITFLDAAFSSGFAQGITNTTSPSLPIVFRD